MLSINLTNVSLPVEIIYNASQLVPMNTTLSQPFHLYEPYFTHATSTPHTNYNNFLSSTSLPQIITHPAPHIYDVSQIPLPEPMAWNIGHENDIDSARTDNTPAVQAESVTHVKHHKSGKKYVSDNFNSLYRKILCGQRTRREKEIAERKIQLEKEGKRLNFAVSKKLAHNIAMKELLGLIGKRETRGF